MQVTHTRVRVLGTESLTDVSDEELLRRIQAGDIPAFEALYDRFSARAFGIARMICRDAHRAEDAVQDGFLSVWRSRDRYDPVRGSVQAWLLTLVRHCSIDHVRRTRRADSLCESDSQLDYLPASESVADDAEGHDDAVRVRESLRGLPVVQREVIALAYFGGLTHTEIAARLDLPAGTVKGRMRLGLQKVRTEFNSPRSPALRRSVPPMVHAGPAPR